MRLPFLVKYTRSGAGGTGTDTYRTTCSCTPAVADFLNIRDRMYTPSEADLATRAGYTREYTKPDGTKGQATVAEGKRVYLANTRAGKKTVILTTGGKTTKGTRRTLSITFPSFLNVAEIADALGELIPTGKVATSATVQATEVEPSFKLLGGRSYPIVKSADAIASTATDVAISEAEQVTIVTTTKSRKRRGATTP
jgi:hypothetical protein